MSSKKNILIAFLLNLTFSILEFVGGIFTHSVAILSDSVHDLGDATSIGVSYFLEKKSERSADCHYTYGYARYSVLGGLFTGIILLIGSAFVIYRSILRIITPQAVDYHGMIIFAVFGVITNFLAAWFTREGNSINQKSVNLHMLEDVLGWTVVLIGSIIMNFTDISLIDPIMSIAVALFILYSAFSNIKEIGELFLEKTPDGIDVEKLKQHLMKIDGITDIHHIHVRSIDGIRHDATMHVVTNALDLPCLKAKIREELAEHNICHSVIETESKPCGDADYCQLPACESSGHHHHHHH